MEKKNTLLLTIIAVATLLVAVVGATFAYFTATGSGSEASNVQVQTSSIDSISSAADHIALTVTLADMLEDNGDNDNPPFVNAFGDIRVTVDSSADSATRTCTYDVVYTPTDVFTNTVANTSNLNELTIQGTSTVGGSPTGDAIAERSLSGLNAATNLASDLTFTYSGGAETILDWDFEIRFYNLAINQSELAGDTFGGALTVENLVCVADTTP